MCACIRLSLAYTIAVVHVQLHVTKLNTHISNVRKKKRKKEKHCKENAFEALNHLRVLLLENMRE